MNKLQTLLDLRELIRGTSVPHHPGHAPYDPVQASREWHELTKDWRAALDRLSREIDRR